MSTIHLSLSGSIPRARSAVASALALAVLVAAPCANAGTTAPLSSLAALSRPAPVKLPEATTSIPGLTVKTKAGYGSTRWHDLNVATGLGYCLHQGDGRSWMSTYGVSEKGAVEELRLDRLVEKDGTATIERTALRFDPSDASVTPLARSHVELHEIAKTGDGIVVWAYRDGATVMVLARRVDGGQEPRQLNTDVGFPFLSVEGCGYAGVRLDARKPEAGSFAQLTVSLPVPGAPKDSKEKKVTPQTFTIDVSLSRVARDPEPMLSVRVRRRE